MKIVICTTTTTPSYCKIKVPCPPIPRRHTSRISLALVASRSRVSVELDSVASESAESKSATDRFSERVSASSVRRSLSNWKRTGMGACIVVTWRLV